MTPDPLSCGDVRRLLQIGAHSDGTLAHIGQCEACLEQALKGVLRLRQDPAVPPRFDARMLAQLESALVFSQPPAQLSRHGVWLSVAATIAVAFAILYVQDLMAVTGSLWGTALLALASIELSLIVAWVVSRERAEWAGGRTTG